MARGHRPPLKAEYIGADQLPFFSFSLATLRRTIHSDNPRFSGTGGENGDPDWGFLSGARMRPLASDVHSFIHAKFLPADWVRGRKPSNDLASLADIDDA